MKVLIGTTNPSKIKRIQTLLDGCHLEFCSLQDLGIDREPQECGRTPEENAIIKANFYSQYFDPVICNDSGLYFDTLPIHDIRQPGLNIRTPQGTKRLDDEEMIAYYTNFVHEIGGKVTAYYLDGFAVCCNGKTASFMENSNATRCSAFYMIDKPSDKRTPGWPLDSISVNRKTNIYFTEQNGRQNETQEEQIILGAYRTRLIAFLKESLGL